MKSITQFDQEKDTESLISAFSKLIGLADLSKKVNFKRHSLVSLLMVITWMIKARFARKSLYRCQRAKNFTAKTGRNVLNDGRINWQKLVCLTAVKLISVLKPVIDRRRRLALIVDDTLMARSCSKKTELLAKVYDHDKHKFLTGYRGLSRPRKFIIVTAAAFMMSKDCMNVWLFPKCIRKQTISIAARLKPNIKDMLFQLD